MVNDSRAIYIAIYIGAVINRACAAEQSDVNNRSHLVIGPAG